MLDNRAKYTCGTAVLSLLLLSFLSGCASHKQANYEIPPNCFKNEKNRQVSLKCMAIINQEGEHSALHPEYVQQLLAIHERDEVIRDEMEK